MPRKPPPKMITVSQAAKLIHMTTGGIYAAIKRGDIPATRKPGQQIMVKRADVKEHRRRFLEFLRQSKKPKVLTEEEFIRQLWENDPD